MQRILENLSKDRARGARVAALWLGGWTCAVVVAAAAMAGAGGNGAGTVEKEDAGDASRQVGNTEARAAAMRSQRCESCHAFDAATSHPIGVRPPSKFAGGLPLVNGVMTCTTCHEQEEHAAGKGPMLRDHPSRGTAGATGNEVENLCAACHEKSGGTRIDAHGSGLRMAHLGSDTGSARRRIGAQDPGIEPNRSGRASVGMGILDSESQACVSCHDGISASDAGSHPFGARGSDRQGSSEHPVGVRYPSTTAARAEVRLVERVRLDPRVRLFGSAIGCGSCHNPYSKQRDLLVMSNQGSKLCLSCHVE